MIQTKPCHQQSINIVNLKYCVFGETTLHRRGVLLDSRPDFKVVRRNSDWQCYAVLSHFLGSERYACIWEHTSSLWFKYLYILLKMVKVVARVTQTQFVGRDSERCLSDCDKKWKILSFHEEQLLVRLNTKLSHTLLKSVR